MEEEREGGRERETEREEREGEREGGGDDGYWWDIPFPSVRGRVIGRY